MWCPKCRNEYVDGVTTCVDCGCELVVELPDEIDTSVPQIIGTVENEEIARKFIQYFKFSGLQTAGFVPHDEDEGVDLAVAYEELDEANALIQGFLKEDSQDELDLEKILPILEQQLSEIKDEKAKELLSDLRQEASTVYVNKKDKYADLTFSGYSFIVFAILGYLFAALNLTGVISLLFNRFSMLVLIVIFTVFLFIGISTLRKAVRVRALIKEEEQILGQVEAYIETTFTDDYLATLDNPDLSEEENFFHVTEILKAEIIKEFPLFSKGYADQLVDDMYGDYCDRKNNTQDQTTEDDIE